MSIQISYLDTRRATIKMLRAYRDMQWKAAHGKDRVKEIRARLESLPATLGKTPVSGGSGNRAEEALIAGIDQITVAERGYLEAAEFIETVDACMGQLSAEARRILELRFIDYLERGGVARIADEFNVSQREAYRRSDEALDQLKTLLFW